jgi:hypothetical protein
VSHTQPATGAVMSTVTISVMVALTMLALFQARTET